MKIPRLKKEDRSNTITFDFVTTHYVTSAHGFLY